MLILTVFSRNHLTSTNLNIFSRSLLFTISLFCICHKISLKTNLNNIFFTSMTTTSHLILPHFIFLFLTLLTKNLTTFFLLQWLLPLTWFYRISLFCIWHQIHSSNRHIFKFTQATHLTKKSQQLFFTSMTTNKHLILSDFIFLFLTLNY